MSAPWTVAALLAVVLVVVLLVGSIRERAARRRASAQDASARAEADALRLRLEQLEARVGETERAPGRSPEATHPSRPAEQTDPAEHVITLLGQEKPGAPDDGARIPATVPPSLFADLVLREGVVQVAALAAGVRRALAPEQRHRVRLEMRREVKRSRKQRRTEVREARRALADRQRSAA